MPDLTIGQRIAQQRKLLQLSQEALGEQMGVSRQAISKWESDATVPEIDKLIALSKLFSVSVGWLLGTESEIASEPKESFSEEQLHTVEEIVKRYHQPPVKSKDWIPAAVAGAVLLSTALIGTMAFFWNYLNQFAGNVSHQFYNVNNNYIAIQDQLGGLTDRLDELAKGEKLLEGYTVEGTSWEDMTGATIRFSGTPKYTVAGETAWLCVRLNEEDAAKVPCSTDGIVYIAEVDLPAADGYSFYFQVAYKDGGSAQQILTKADDHCVNLLRALNGTVTYTMKGWHYSWQTGSFGVHFLANRTDPPLFREGVSAAWTKADLVVLLNGEEIQRKSYLGDFSSGVAYEVYSENGVDHVLYTDGVNIQYEYSASDIGDTDLLTVQLEYSFGSNPVSVQPVIRFWMENGEPKVEKCPILSVS